MVVLGCNPSTWKQRQEEQEFKANLSYTEALDLSVSGEINDLLSPRAL